MQHSPHPQGAIDRAYAALESMRSAPTLAEFEEHWKTYLWKLERVWSKSEAHFSRSPKWSGWHGRYLRARRDDPLISYLKYARDADEHSVEEIVTYVGDNSLTINPMDGNAMYIESFALNKHGLTVTSPQTLTIKFSPKRMKLLPVSNRGQVKSPPNSYLGKAVHPDDVIRIAEMGLEFYEDFLGRATKKTVG